MNRDLAPRERQLLQRLTIELQYKSRVVRKLQAMDRSVLAWCEEQDLLTIPVELSPSRAVEYGYTSELLQAIEARLLLLGLAPITANLKASSLDQAVLGGAEHKSTRINPRECRVLRIHNTQIIDQNHSELLLEHYSEIVVIENLDCFYELNRFNLPLAMTSLVIYRGDTHYSAGRAKLLKRWQEGNYGPLKYFGDLDPEGIHIAISEGFSHLAVPDLAWFTENATSHAYASKQHDIAVKLQHTGQLQLYIAFIQRHQRALLQQWLQNVPLQWLLIHP